MDNKPQATATNGAASKLAGIVSKHVYTSMKLIEKEVLGGRFAGGNCKLRIG